MQLANGWGYHCLELGKKRIVYGGVTCIGWNEYAHPNIAVSKVCFLAWTCFEIKCLNMPGIWASVFYCTSFCFDLHYILWCAVYVHVCIIHVPILQHSGCSYDISIITKLQVVHIRCKLELCRAHTPRVPCVCICACNFDICSWWRLSTSTYMYVACHVHEQKAQHMHSRHNQWAWLWWPTKIH